MKNYIDGAAIWGPRESENILEQMPSTAEITHLFGPVEKQDSIEHCDVLQKILDQLQPISFSKRAALEEEDKLKKHHFVIETISEVLSKAEQSNWSMSIKNGNIFVYNGAFWKALDKSEIENFLGESALKLGVDRYEAKYHLFRSDLVKQLMSSAYLLKPPATSEKVLINLKNGTFIITPQGYELKEFEPGDFLRYQLPFEYNKEIECPKFQTFLDKVLPDSDQQKILAEYISYVFIKQKTLKLEKCMVLYGKGANGKSVFFDVINALLGPENVSSYSLQSLTSESGYHRATLGTKLLNYASEISSHMDSAYFKQLVSGEPVDARLPYGTPFILEDYSKFLFNANELPRDVEQNEAFFRRFIIINFDVKIQENERDPELAQKIISDELPGVFNWVLAGLSRLLNQKKFSVSEIANQALNDYKINSDSVHLFLQDQMYEKSLVGELSLHSFYKMYNAHSLESGYKPTSKRVFADRLRNLDFTIERKNTGNFVNVQKKVL